MYESERERAVSQAMMRWFRIKAATLPDVREGKIKNPGDFCEKWTDFRVYPPIPTKENRKKRFRRYPCGKVCFAINEDIPF